VTRSLLPLSYDDLPPGSDLRRRYDGEAVHILIPAGEPPPTVVKQTAYDALASGAAASWALLVLSFVVFYSGLQINRISGVPLIWAWGFFAIFCAALVLLVAWVRYGTMIDAIRAGRRQATGIAATPQRIRIETSGPFGIASYDFARGQIKRIVVGRSRLRDDRGQARRVMQLVLHLTDGRAISLLPGRDRRELRWIRATLESPAPR
jgi:hypothetical protein